jgi:hypothetical protein
MSAYASSDGSDTSSLGAFNYRLPIGAKCNIGIQLDNHFKTKVYTSSSPVSGNVVLSTARDTRFDSVQILLLGTSRTRVDGLRAPHATTHTFLKLEMPIPESAYPIPRIYEAGRTYRIPFNFVIPNHLTLNACNHSAETDGVHEYHLCLPPTVGSWDKEDLSPDMARVDYSIKARILRDGEVDSARIKLLEASQPLKVLPAYPEHAPLNITAHDRLYQMSKSKTLRKSLLSAKTGKITASATQPAAVMMSADGRSASSANVQLNLNFVPVSSQSAPPKVTSVSSKLTAVTFYSAGAVNTFPNLGDWHRAFGADTRGSYPSTVSLPSGAVPPVDWRTEVAAQPRRDSGYDSEHHSEGEHSGHSSGENRRRGSRPAPRKTSPVYHTASMQVPIELPVHKKMFIPTFHSCILTRAYVLWLTVSFSTGGINSSLTLAVPLQIGVDSTEALVDSTGLPTFEAALEQAEAETDLAQRSLYFPDVEPQAHVLPGYADLVAGRMVAAN